MTSNTEYVQIAGAAAFAGPLTWPLAALLIARQQGNFSFSFMSQMRTNGVRVAYSGCLPYASYKLFGIGVQRGVQSPTIAYLNGNHEYLPSSFIYGISGVFSGVIGGFIVTPIEQFKISMANGQFSNIRSLSEYFFRNTHGFKALFSGAKITIMRNVLYDSINSILYNNAIKFSWVVRDSSLQMACVNAVAGVATAIIDYPLDVLKTRIQSSTVTLYGPVSQLNQSVPILNIRVVTLTKQIVQQEGVKSLYHGLREKLGLYFAVWFVYGMTYSFIGKMAGKIS